MLGRIPELGKHVVDIPAAGFPFFQKGLDISEPPGILVLQAVPPFGIFLPVKDDIDAGRRVGPEVSIPSVPQLPKKVGPHLPGLFQSQLPFLMLGIERLKKADGRFDLIFGHQVPGPGCSALGGSRIR